MSNDAPIDILQVKIDKAMEALPRATRKAIEAVDWKSAILSMREKKGYNFEQLEDLELQTELVLSGLLKPEDYPQKLEENLGISRSQVDLLVNEMNEFVFKKIREELIKNSDRESIFIKKEESIGKAIPDEKMPYQSPPVKSVPAQVENKVATPSGDIAKVIAENNAAFKKLEQEVKIPEPTQEVSAEAVDKKTISNALADKLSVQYKTGMTRTEYSLNNLSKDTSGSTVSPLVNKSVGAKADPYRIDPNE